MHEMRQELLAYLKQQIQVTPQRLQRFTHEVSGKAYPQRFMFKKLSKYAGDFLDKTSATKMVVVPGFRGVGKTTLMAQVCSEYKSKAAHTLFLSIEDVRSFFNVGIAELMTAYAEIIGENLESLSAPILVFLDEIQSDPKWAVTLKSLFERTSNIFFCCTGSAALILQTTSNLARRAVFEKMPPLCFTEYQMIEHETQPAQDLKDKIRQAVYFSKDAAEVFEKLSALKSEVHSYWLGIDRADIRKFLAYGTLPFALTMPNETAVYDSISLLLDKIINLDLPTLGSFSTDTLSMVRKLLFAIAESDVTSLKTLEDNFGLHRATLLSIFDALEKAEVLIKVPAYGSNMTAAKKPSKYLFMSPAIRMSYFYFTGDENTLLTRQGKLLGDLVGAHLHQEFVLKNQGAMRYDSAQGGADFILQILNNKRIIIEISMGKKNKKQIATSIKKIKSDYNLVFSASGLEIDPELNLVFVPLDYVLLM